MESQRGVGDITSDKYDDTTAQLCSAKHHTTPCLNFAIRFIIRVITFQKQRKGFVGFTVLVYDWTSTLGIRLMINVDRSGYFVISLGGADKIRKLNSILAPWHLSLLPAWVSPTHMEYDTHREYQVRRWGFYYILTQPGRKLLRSLAHWIWLEILHWRRKS